MLPPQCNGPTRVTGSTLPTAKTVEWRATGLISRDNYLPGKSKNTSIRVVFDDVLDGTSVEADDFTVDGTAPSAAMRGTRRAAPMGHGRPSPMTTIPTV